MSVNAWVGLAVAVIVFIAIGSGRATGLELGPEDDWCGAAKALGTGQELVLRPGDYPGPCSIRTGGAPGAPLVIRAADRERRPRIVYSGSTANVVEIRADHIVIRDLEFGPTARDVDGIRIITGNDITIENCAFLGLGGIAVVANHTSVRGLYVRHNVIRGSEATAMYFGCHDGLSCTVSDLVVERNLIERVRAPDPEIGYGVQVKLNSTGLVRDNIIVDTKGPGIMVYGAQALTNRTVVERNVTVGSQTSAGVVVGGGPTIVRNNIAMANAAAGIALEDYMRRGLLRGVVVVHNSVYRNGGGGIAVPAEKTQIDATIVNNAVHARPGMPALPGWQPGLRLAGNVDCSGGGCFTDPEGWNFSPFRGSRLVARGLVRGEEGGPGEDFSGKPRRIPPTVGAFEDAAGPVTLEIEGIGPLRQ